LEDEFGVCGGLGAVLLKSHGGWVCLL
jgi:hypothetical protein